MVAKVMFQAVRIVRHRTLPLLLVVAFLSGILSAPVLVGSTAAEPLAGTVSVDPPNSDTSIGASTAVDLRSDGVGDIYGAQFSLSFDAAHIEVVDANAAQTGTQITPGACPAPDFVAANSADNTAGTVTYAVTQLSPTPACSGGVIATVEFRCRDTAGVFPITIVESLLSDPDGTAISHSTQSGQITCVENMFTISGQAVPQGHPADAVGIEVCLEGSDCVSTGVDGAFSFMALASEVHTVTANFEGHLTVEATGITGSVGELVELGQGMLRAGDLNQDGTINILDLVTVGGNFDRSGPTGW